MKKKLIIIAVVIAVIVMIIGCLYVFSGLERVEVQTHGYLLGKGYTNADIETINVTFSPLNWNISYNGWTSTVVFADEPSVNYHFIYSDEKISSNGFTSKDATPEKLKQFE